MENLEGMYISSKQSVSLSNIDELFYYCKPTKFIKKCPCCYSFKLLFIYRMDYHNRNISNFLQTTQFRKPICIKCFDSFYYKRVLSKYNNGVEYQ